MSLRCKPGDLAMVVCGIYKGYFVTVLEFAGRAYGTNPSGHSHWKDDCWVTTYPRDAMPIPGTDGDCMYADNELLPIRPGDLKETEDASSLIQFSCESEA